MFDMYINDLLFLFCFFFVLFSWIVFNTKVFISLEKCLERCFPQNGCRVRLLSRDLLHFCWKRSVNRCIQIQRIGTFDFSIYLLEVSGSRNTVDYTFYCLGQTLAIRKYLLLESPLWTLPVVAWLSKSFISYYCYIPTFTP